MVPAKKRLCVFPPLSIGPSGLFARKLTVVELTVKAALVQQFTMTPLFQNLTVIHHKNPVGLFDRRQAVSDDEACAALHHLIERRLDQQLRPGIDRAGRFI